jgi:Mg2+-importing ATPase
MISGVEAAAQEAGAGAAPERPYWAAPIDDLLTGLGSTRSGMKSQQATERLRLHGRNVLQESARAGVFRLMLHQFSNPLVLILVAAAAVSALVREPADSLIIVVVLLGSAMLMLLQEYRANKAIARLRAKLILRTRVLRDGHEADVPAEEIVAGDVVLLAAGALIPADGILLEADDLFVNQAVLTGESVPTEKRPGVSDPAAGLAARANTLFMGTSVRSGTGTLLVVATGTHTEYGAIARKLTRQPPETEFERGIRRFGYLLTRIILVLVVAVFAANVFLDRPPIDALLFAIALAVGISPELLPAIIVVTLARGAHEMAKQGVIVRRLNAIENFGSMDVLCCDKTGTLTEGTMRLHAALGPDGQPSERVLTDAIANARLQTGMHNPLDQALLDADTTGHTAGGKLEEIPYDFTRRRVTVAVRDGGGVRLLTKGALEQLLEVCTTLRDHDQVVPLAQATRIELHSRLKEWSDEGFRVLGFATRPVALLARYSRDAEQEMTFEGFLLFADRPKAGVGRVLQEMRDLGVQVKVITGDNRYVARHVANVVALDGGTLVTGPELDKLTDEALWRSAPATTVFAEVDPNQKERIILALRKAGSVVGYLGDGINDVPALHAADVGISVDGAADVARETADLVLLRHDLDVLRRGITSGRNTFANTLKYIYITTSANFGNMVSMAAASFVLPFLPLLATQILLNNFLSDVPALALAGDRVEPAQTQRPQKWQIRPIRNFMIVFGLISSAFDLLTFGLLVGVFAAAAPLFRTGWFVLSLMTEIIVVFVVRTRGSLKSSRPSWALAALSAATALVAITLPYTALGRVFEFVPLPPHVLVTLLALTLAYGAATQFAKYYFFRVHSS